MEVEIKLHVLPTAPGGPSALFERLAAAERLAGYLLGPAERIGIRDVYYDTTGSVLARAGAGLRLRVENGASLVTLKVSRRRSGSLSAREEYEYPLDEAHFDRILAQIRSLIGPDPVPLAAFAAGRPAGPLHPVLDVVTERIARSVGDLGTLALDRVEYRGLAVGPFFDIEMEAHDGMAGEAALRSVEAELVRLAGGHLAPATMSKLERGLRLKEGPPGSGDLDLTRVP